MNNNKLKVYLPLILAGILLAGIMLGLELNRVRNGVSLFGQPRQDKINEVINYVKRNYVDTVSRSQLEEKAITGMLQSLDRIPYTSPPASFTKPTIRCWVVLKASEYSSTSNATPLR